VVLAARYRLPAVYPLRVFAASGGLISDGVDPTDIFRRAASYVDRILMGANPGDLPLQAPTKFELVINLKTANTLGLNVPPMLLPGGGGVIKWGRAFAARGRRGGPNFCHCFRHARSRFCKVFACLASMGGRGCDCPPAASPGRSPRRKNPPTTIHQVRGAV